MNAQSTNRDRTYRIITFILVVIGLLFLMVVAANAKTITVTGTGDTIAVDGLVTLREAITAANTNMAAGDAPAGDAGLDVINFNISGGGLKTISPTSALPTITDPITINGYSQGVASPNSLATGDNAVILIELSGAAANATAGLTISAGNCTIRGLVINRFNVRGIELQSTGGTTIAGNFIGTDMSGKTGFPSPNNGSGIYLTSPNNTIGGTALADRNVLSGNGNANGGVGVYVDKATAKGNKIIGNYIGLDASGTAPVSNYNVGVFLVGGSSNSIVGGTSPAERNVLSGNSQGVTCNNSSSNQIIGNYIGTTADGASGLSNTSGVGVEFIQSSNNNNLGGTISGSGNLIAFNTGQGVAVFASTNNAILGNSIHSNFQLGIDLYVGAAGVTPNDNNVGDMDSGPNNLQNFPVITSAVSNAGTTTIKGTLDSAFATKFRIEFFSNTAKNASGFGEGKNFLGFANVTTDNQGQGGFTFTVPTANVIGGFFTATATDPNGNTSEFSASGSGVVSSPGTLQFSTSSILQKENDGAFTINVTRTNGSAGTVTVNYATADGTAKAPADYTNTSGTLTFNDGDMSKQIIVPFIDDNTPEGSEFFTLTLSNPTGGAVLGNIPKATMVIQDNEDPTLSINDVSQAEGHSGTTAFTFTVTSSNAITNDVTVNYATANGTATAGSDYQSANGVLTILAGQTTKTFTVNVSGDATQEPDETFVVNLSLASNATIAKAQGTGTIINDDAPASPTIQFNQASYTTLEDLGALTITVTRSGDSSGSASVDYVTNDGAATQKGDFEYAAGKLTFAPGDTSKTFQVLVNEDMYLEGNETFGLTLSNATGATLGAQSTASVSITDDAPESLTNPIDDAQSFVHMLYHDFLNREPDQAGLVFWTGEINACGANQACIDTKRASVSAAFFLSIEFQQTGFLVERIYKASYGNLPGAPVPVRLDEFVPDARSIGQGVVVGQAGWEQVLENNKQAFALEFVQRSRFTQAYPTSMTPDQFVDAMFANAGLVPLPAERQAAISDFAGSVSTTDTAARARSLREIAESPALSQQEFNAAFVLMQYFGYLRRDPNAAPEPGLNYDGYNFWLSKLNQFNGNYNDAEMVKAFLISSEYRQRFGF